jgi:hypothetical protein
MTSKIKKSDTKELVNNFSYIYMVKPSRKHLEKKFGTELKNYNIIKIGRSGDSVERIKTYNTGGKIKGTEPMIKIKDIIINREDEEKAEDELKEAFMKQFKKYNVKGDKDTEYYYSEEGMMSLFEEIIDKKYQIKEFDFKECKKENTDLLAQIKKLQDENAELKKQLNKPKDEDITELLAHIDRLNEDLQYLNLYADYLYEDNKNYYGINIIGLPMNLVDYKDILKFEYKQDYKNIGFKSEIGTIYKYLDTYEITFYYNSTKHTCIESAIKDDFAQRYIKNLINKTNN